MSRNPADFVDLTGGGLDLPGDDSPAPAMMTPTAIVPPPPPVFAPPPPAPVQVASVDGLTVEDNGGGPTAQHCVPVVQVQPAAVMVLNQDASLQANQGTASMEPVQQHVDSMINAMMGGNTTGVQQSQTAPAVVQQPIQQPPVVAPTTLPVVTPVIAPVIPPVAANETPTVTPTLTTPEKRTRKRRAATPEGIATTAPLVEVKPAVMAPVVAPIAAPAPPVFAALTQSAVPAVVPPVPIAAPTPSAPMPVPLQQQAYIPPPTQGGTADSDILWKEIEEEIMRLRYSTGVVVLDDPSKMDRNSVLHVAIWNMRHNPQGMILMSPRDLCVFESALSAHQVWVASVENWWTVRCEFLGPELSKILRMRRGNYKGDTEKAREDMLCANEPDVERMRRDFVKAKAIAKYMEGMGERFSKLEDGLKRPINQRQFEEQRSTIGARQNP